MKSTCVNVTVDVGGCHSVRVVVTDKVTEGAEG